MQRNGAKDAGLKSAAKKQNRQSLASIKIGEIIEFERGGVTIRAEKMAPAYQFKTPWFKVVGEFEYVHKTEIKDWRIVADNAATPSETPQISTGTAETVNVSAEGENEAERAEIAITSITQLNVLKYKLQHPKLKEWAVKYGLLDLVRKMFCAPELSLGGLWIDNKFRQSLCENDKAIIAAVRKLIAETEKAA